MSVESTLKLVQETNGATVETKINGSAVLDALGDFLTRYVIMNEAQATASVLWVVHTHAIEAAEATPYLWISSVEKESGKTRLQEALELVVRSPLATSDISEAALFRSIAKGPLTLLFDEIDAIFGPKARDREDMRSLLNAGHRRGRTVMRCVGDGGKQRVEPFEVFCPKALAGIGELPETVASRSIPIRLKRKAKHETVERFRLRHARTEAEPLSTAIAEWAETIIDHLTAARPDLPDELSDRQQDGWEPLLAIADTAGERWPDRARQAAIELANDSQDSASKTAELLAATRAIFAAEGVDKIHSSKLIELLAADEESRFVKWWNPDKEQPQAWAQKTLADQVKGYGVRSEQIWADGKNAKGYTRAAFEDAWARYLVEGESSAKDDPDGIPF